MAPDILSPALTSPDGVPMLYVVSLGVRIPVVVLALAFAADAHAAFSDADWVSLGGFKGVNGTVFAVVTDTNAGLVYIGGSFTTVGSLYATNVAVWDGSHWGALGPGVKGTVSALT